MAQHWNNCAGKGFVQALMEGHQEAINGNRNFTIEDVAKIQTDFFKH